MNMDFTGCEKVLERVYRTNRLHEAIVLIENESGEISWSKGYSRTVDSLFNLASITKLFVTTVVLQLVEQGKLDLNDKISRYLDERTMQGLHVYRGKDYSGELCIRHLLFQISGLPDYYFAKTPDGVSFEDVMWNDNAYIPFEQMIETSKRMQPQFEPGMTGRAYYADLNFDLLGKILENILGEELAVIFDKAIFQPLGLKSTYIITEAKPYAPKAYRNGIAHDIAEFLRCCPASGGGVTTAREFMLFLKAFWTGRLFDKSLLEPLKSHNRLQRMYGCIQYSGGHMYINAAFPFQEKHELRGHSGASGCFAYYCEETGMYFVGDINDSRVYLPANMLLMMEGAVSKALKKSRGRK